MLKVPRFDGETFGNLATFTVPAKGTDREYWAIALVPPARALASGEATAGPAAKPMIDAVSRVTTAPAITVRLMSPPMGDGTGKVLSHEGPDRL
jgi:hypothetical protein